MVILFFPSHSFDCDKGVIACPQFSDIQGISTLHSVILELLKYKIMSFFTGNPHIYDLNIKICIPLAEKAKELFNSKIVHSCKQSRIGKQVPSTTKTHTDTFIEHLFCLIHAFNVGF